MVHLHECREVVGTHAYDGQKGRAPMTRRLATMYLLMALLIGVNSPFVWAQDTEDRRETLKGMSAVEVLVESLPDGAKVLGLTEESIQTDVELKLRLAGMRVLKPEEWTKTPGFPYLYVEVSVLAAKDGSTACYIAVELHQNALLERNGQFVAGATTWDTSFIGLNQDAQDIRNKVKDHIDKFLNAWLSVNPK